MVGIPAAARPTHARRMKGTVIEMLTARALLSVDKITAQTQQASIPPTTAAKQTQIQLQLQQQQLQLVDAMVGIPAAARPTNARRMKGTVIEMLTARALSSVDKITAQTQQASIPPTTAAKQTQIQLQLQQHQLPLQQLQLV